jgi:ubiquinone/menaquinone biosynthesis C-methylase UbiE
MEYVNEDNPQPMSLEEYNAMRINHWDQIAEHVDVWRPWNKYYHHRLAEIYRFLIPPGTRVLELGSGSGDLLSAVKPSCGVGVDFSRQVVERARQRHPSLTFIQADVHAIDLGEKFDFIIISDLIDDVWDVEQILKQARKQCTPKTRLIINYYSRVWAPILALTESLGLSKPRLPQNWLVVEDVTNLLYLAGFEVLRNQREILWPLPVRPVEIFFNRFLAKIWPFSLLDLTNFTIARPIPQQESQTEESMVSVIVPARNEAGNIPNIFARVPEIGRGTELVFVEGHSRDNTYEAIQQSMAQSSRNCKLFRQTGVGKGDAVRMGFSQASGDVLMILDADLTVAPEDLPKFYEVLLTGKGDLVNGVRLVYPMEEQAMRFLNLIGNKFFGQAFTWLLGQPIKDTLCGTKALWRSDYEQIKAHRGYFGDFDPFGDFDLLFGAAKLNAKIVDMPIRYRERAYGATNIQRWRHGWLLLRMVFFAALRIKFI